MWSIFSRSCRKSGAAGSAARTSDAKRVLSNAAPPVAAIDLRKLRRPCLKIVIVISPRGRRPACPRVAAGCKYHALIAVVRRPASASPASALGSFAVVDDAYLLDGDEAARHHAVECRQKRFNSRFGIDDFDDHWQIVRELEDLGGMQDARLAEADRAADHGGAGKACFARLEHERFIERQVAVPVLFADEDAQQCRVFWNLHGILLRLTVDRG